MALIMSGNYAVRALPKREPKVVHEVSQEVHVVETVEVIQRPSEVRTDLLTPESSWGWEEVRDYVVAQIEARTGTFPRDARKEASIFQRFCRQFGPDAPAIARFAFEVADGRWKGAPIGINRFCKASDSWFADPILARIKGD